MRFIQRQFMVIYCLFLSAVLVLGGTWATYSTNQDALNEAGVKPGIDVTLEKYERSPQGVPTDVLLPGAEFRLYHADGTPYDDKIYTTDENGRIRLRLPAGNYYFEEVKPAPGHGFDRDPATGELIRRYPFSVPAAGGDPLTVKVYNPLLNGGLTITKTVENKDGSALTPAQREKEFTFVVQFLRDDMPCRESFSYTVYHADGSVASTGTVEDGYGTLKLKHGQSAVFPDLPEGVQYIVTEVTPDPVGEYTVSGNHNSGTITVQGSSADFKNTYQRALLEIVKVVVNGDGSPLTEAQRELEFRFTVTFSDGGRYPYTILNAAGEVVSTGNKLESGGLLRLKHGQRAIFEDLPDGVSYTVTEQPMADYHPVVGEYKGTLVGGFTALARFENRYDDPHEPDKDPDGWLEVGKQIRVHGETLTPAQKEEIFTFRVRFNYRQGTFRNSVRFSIRDSGGKTLKTGYLKSGDTFTLSHGQKIIFNGLPSGLTYTVTEVDPKDYRPIQQEISGGVSGGSFARFLFQNVPVEEETGDLILTKQVEGADPEGRQFNFRIFFSDEITAFPYEIQGESGETLSTGQAKTGHVFALRHGEKAVFRGLPRGLRYTITEQDYADEGFYLSMVNGTGTIQGGTTVAVAVNYTDERIISGVKTWDLGGADVALPDGIWVRLMQGDALVERVQVKPDGDGNWSYSFTVPKYDAEGGELDYRVEEEPVENFSAAYDGYNILNSYVPPPTPTPEPSGEPTPTPTTPPEIPKTGDDRHPGLWFFSLLFSLAGLTGCFLYACSCQYQGKRVRYGRVSGVRRFGYRGRRLEYGGRRRTGR